MTIDLQRKVVRFQNGVAAPYDRLISTIPLKRFAVHAEDLPVFRLLRLRARRIPALIDGLQKISQRRGLLIPCYGHAGDGNIHVIIMDTPADNRRWARVEEANQRIVEKALAFEGTCTGEHGVGIGKRRFLADEHGESLALMKRIKTLIDPDVTNIVDALKQRSAERDVSVHSAWASESTSSSMAFHLSGHLTSPSSAVNRAELARQLDTILQGMNEIDREVLALRHFEELTNSETARVLNMSEQAASGRYMRALGRLKQILEIPVTDFELSVRSRNCLQKMGVRNLGDLTRLSEQELLGGKNFGETSLREIKEMMESKGLHLGQFVMKEKPRDYGYQEALSPQQQALLNRPVADLNLSVRARKCMSRLGITTLGELILRNPDELLESKNFGVTSLNEVRDKLTTLGLKLKND